MDDLHDDLSDLAAHVADELASADGGQLAPLSDARLAELRAFAALVSRMIEEEWTVTGTFGDDGIGQALRDAADIIRVLAERERLLAVVERVAAWPDDIPLWSEEEEREWLADLDNHWPCSIDTDLATGVRTHHGPCFIEQARALVAAPDAE